MNILNLTISSLNGSIPEVTPSDGLEEMERVSIEPSPSIKMDEWYKLVPVEALAFLKANFLATESQVRNIQSMTTVPLAVFGVVMATLGYSLLAATVLRTKEFDSFFYRLILVDAVVEWLMSVGILLKALFEQGSNQGYLCRKWYYSKLDGVLWQGKPYLYGWRIRGDCSNWFTSFLNSKWPIWVIPGQELAGWIAICVVIDRFIGFHFPVKYRAIVQNNRKKLFLGAVILLALNYTIVAFPLNSYLVMHRNDTNPTGQTRYYTLNMWPGDYPGYQTFMWYYWQPLRALIQIILVVGFSAKMIHKALIDIPRQSQPKPEELKRNRSVVAVTLVTLSLTCLVNCSLLFREFWNFLNSSLRARMNVEEKAALITTEELKTNYFQLKMVRWGYFLQDLTSLAYGLNFYMLLLLVGSFRRAFAKNVLPPSLGKHLTVFRTTKVAPSTNHTKVQNKSKGPKNQLEEPNSAQ